MAQAKFTLEGAPSKLCLGGVFDLHPPQQKVVWATSLGTDTAALRNWLFRPYISSLGKLCVAM